MSIRNEIAKNILFFRKRAKITQKELAAALGVTPGAVSNWENGNNSIDIDTLFKMCDLLGVSINEMYGTRTADDYSAHEKEIIMSYRANPEMQPAVDRLLGVEPEEKKDEETSSVDGNISVVDALGRMKKTHDTR